MMIYRLGEFVAVRYSRLNGGNYFWKVGIISKTGTDNYYEVLSRWWVSGWGRQRELNDCLIREDGIKPLVMWDKREIRRIFKLLMLFSRNGKYSKLCEYIR
jgi:hypothetical protein